MNDKKSLSAEDEVTDIWKNYEKGKEYQNTIALRTKLPMYVKFFEGEQWAEPTENTKNMPRPVLNIIKMICRNKKSALLSSKVRITYKSVSADSIADDVEKLNDFASAIQKEMHIEQVDKEAIEDAVKKGSYFYHFYWDVDAEGIDGSREGALRCELIDPLNIFFSNPRELSEQKQKWILISSRMDISAVSQMVDSDVDKDLIKADDNEDGYNTTEQDKGSLCTVLTKYFRRNGEVYCERATKNTIINKAFPITPDIEGEKRNMGIEDAPGEPTPDAPHKRPVKARLYPIVSGYYERKNNCIYGIGEVEGLIPNQKAINFNVAMSLLNAQEVAWGKYIALPNALKGQKITNAPGQVLIDYSGTGNGIHKMTEQTMQSMPITLVETIVTLTRSFTGATEVMTGEAIGSNQSGAAIAQLQATAQQPIEELRDTFWQVKKKQGEVIAQFFKTCYVNKSFIRKAPNKIQNYSESDEYIEDTFSSEDYSNYNFDIVVEASQGTKSSVSGDIQMLDYALQKGAIDFNTFVAIYPQEALTNKSELLKSLEKVKNDQLMQLQAQNQQLLQNIQQFKQFIMSKQKSIESVEAITNENANLKEKYAQLYAVASRLESEAKTKIMQANDTITKQNQLIAKEYNDAKALANELDRRDTEGAQDKERADLSDAGLNYSL